MDVGLVEGQKYSLVRGDTIVVTMAGPVSPQGRLLMQRQLHALFPAQKVVVLDHGMTFQVYSEQAAPEAPAPPVEAPEPTPAPEESTGEPEPTPAPPVRTRRS